MRTAAKPNRALRVCFFAHHSKLWGAERVLLQLVKDLVADHATKCLVVVPEPGGPLAAELTRAGASCVVAKYGWWCATGAQNQTTNNRIIALSLKFLAENVVPAVRKFDPDVVWTQTMVIPWGAIVAAQLRKPHTWYITELGESDHGFTFFQPFSVVKDSILQSSDHVFACSRFVVDTLFPKEKDRVEVLYCHIPPPPEPTINPHSDFFAVPEAVKIGIFSQVAPGKGQEDVVKAVGELCARGRNIELLVVGDGVPEYAKHLVNLSRTLGIDNRVKFPGYLTDPYPAMRASDIVAICSRREAFGRVGVEAMLFGKPVVYPNTGGVAEYMVEGMSGLSYAPGDVSGLVDRLEILIGDPGRRSEIGAFSRPHALQLFSKDNSSGLAFKTLQKICLAGRKAGRLPQTIEKMIEVAIGTLEESGRIGRNEACPCGSGKRFKHCHARFT
jgi:glycosyltransferase involved in cell wall biosynthesis